MIYAEYQHDEASKVFTIRFSNVQLSDSGFKQVNATYHLENAINKAFDNIRPDKFKLTIADKHNYYLKLIGIAIAAYIRGLGYASTDISTENF